jgi:hypothetical protein
VHHAQLEHPACTRTLLLMADAEVRRRERDAKEKRPRRQADTENLDAPPDLSFVSGMVSQTFARLRTLTTPADGGEVDKAIRGLEAYFAVALRVMEHTTARVVRDCTLEIFNESGQAAAEGAPT